MNLGGIKIGSAEIERVVSAIDGIREAAAVAVSPAGGGPGQLVVFAVCHDPGDSKEWLDQTTETVRTHIKDELNPLFRLERLVIVDQLPRTASNKVMRRVLREQAASDSS
jgi:acetyl-CoA synthetase